MDASKDSPLPADGPLNHAPLAPSQEAAYRKKCIQLKKRLQEIESDNDAKRRRIEREKQHVQKMRLNRAILLDHLKRTMEAPAVKLTPEQLARIGIIANGAGHPAEFAGPHPSRAMADNEGLLDDSSDESEEEPEPAERPQRRQRANPSHGEAIMSTNPTHNTPSYNAQQGLPNLAPAAYSPAAGRGANSYSFQLESPSLSAPGRAPQTYNSQAYPTDYGGSHSSPNQSFSAPTAPLREQPVRPEPPFRQFTDHMRPQLEDDSYPADQIDARIQQEWNQLSAENRGLWDQRYQEQMVDFTRDMDDWKRQQRQQGGSFSEARNKGIA